MNVLPHMFSYLIFYRRLDFCCINLYFISGSSVELHFNLCIGKIINLK